MHLDDRLYPPEPLILQGKYRGRRKRIYVPDRRKAGITRTVETKHGWHRAVVKVGEHVVYESKATRNKDWAWGLAISVEIQ